MLAIPWQTSMLPAESGAAAAAPAGGVQRAFQPRGSGGTESGSATLSVWLVAKGDTGFDELRWTMHGDGTLHRDYSYRLDGEYGYYGVTFDHPEADPKSLRWLGQGPYHSRQNYLFALHWASTTACEAK